MDAHWAAEVRNGAKGARNLEDGGRYEEARRSAQRLAEKYNMSAMARNLVGVLLQRAAARIGGGDLSDTFYEQARSAYSEAARLAPNCVVTAVAHGEVLADCRQYSKAISELNRADKIAKPDDPAPHYAGFELRKFGFHKDNNAEMRIRNAKEMLSIALDKLREKVETQVIRREIDVVLQLGGNESVRALNRANHLAKQWPFSVRAQLLLVHIQFQHDFLTRRGISKADIFRSTMSAIQQLEQNFPSSLVIALLHAMLLDELDDPTAVRKCRHALAIEQPADPMTHALFSDHFSGTNREERIVSAKLKIKALHDRIITEAKQFFGSFAMKDRVTDIRVHDLALYAKHSFDTIHNASNFFKEHGQWDFFYGSKNKAFADSKSLMDSFGEWKAYRKLANALGDNVYDIRPMHDQSHLDVISYTEDHLQQDIFRLSNLDCLFDLMLSQKDVAVVNEAEVIETQSLDMIPLAKHIKLELQGLPRDSECIQYKESCEKIQKLWLEALQILYFDYRKIILPLALEFQWEQLKKYMADVNMHRVLKQPASLLIMEPFSSKCWVKGHNISDCKLCLLCGCDSHNTTYCPSTRKRMPEPHLVGCAEQGQHLYAATQVSHRHATALITVEDGNVSVDELVQEFNEMYEWGWKWAAMEQGPKEFHMKFPNVASVELLSKSTLTLKKSGALIKVSKKVSVVRPQGKLSLVWVVVNGVPDERKDPECLREIGSMIGLVQHIDIQMLEEYDKVRMKVYIKDHKKLPHSEMYVVDGDIYPIEFILDSIIDPGCFYGNSDNKNEWSYVLDGRSLLQLDLTRNSKEGKECKEPLGSFNLELKGLTGEKNVTSQTSEKGHSVQMQHQVQPSVPSSVTESTSLPSKEYVVLGKVVPETEVNLFALYCKAAESCKDKHTVCHHCSIEGVADLGIKISEIKDHLKKKHSLVDEPYECEDCHTMARTCADIRRHYHFAHHLPKGWWKDHIRVDE